MCERCGDVSQDEASAWPDSHLEPDVVGVDEHRRGLNHADLHGVGALLSELS
jgi:hypothetical protein